jgi:UDP-N-acetylglucosamine 2-epimerase (non-hydrolysing)
MAPVIQALGARPGLLVRVVATGQHRGMLDQALGAFGIAPDVDLALMRPGQGLPELTARLITGLGEAFEAEKPDMVLVQGDTTSVMAGALAAFYRRTPFGHVEAGLRSGVPDDPFPEEANRRIAGVLADLHFAPTARAAANLRAENVPAERIHLTGNTVVDALRWMVARMPPAPSDGRQRLLVTMHRRENWGGRIRGVCQALRSVLDDRPDVELTLPMHGNPAVREEVEAALGGHPRARLLEPLPYPELVDALRRATVVLTDSGGIQEEAPTFGVPTLVLRATTERPEAVEAGCARLIGTDPDRVRAETLRLLDDPAAHAAMASAANPFGDGRAAERIVDAVAARLEVEGR